VNPFTALRYERGLTQADVIDATGISRGTIYALERGGRPSPPIAKKLADFYGLPVGDIVRMSDERSAA